MDTSAVFATSAETATLAAALARAQGKLETAVKAKLNPHLQSHYADIEAVWNACRKALSEEKIAVAQFPLHSTDGRAYVLTRIECEGQWMQATFSIPVGKQDAQGYVAATTYAKRCALASIVGVVAAEEDDDGHTASQRPAKSHGAVKLAPPQTGPATVTKAEVDRLRIALKEHGHDEKVFGGYLKEVYGFTRWSEITREKYDAVMALAEGADAVVQ